MFLVIGTVMLLVMVLGIAENFALLYTYFTNRKVRTIDNLFIVGIALGDIGQALFGVPFVVVASFSGGWIFDFGVCQYYAFITTCLGISQVSMLTLLAVERFGIIVKSHRLFSNSFGHAVTTIMFSFMFGSGWAIGPLVGWSSYEVESKGIACSVSWEITDAVSLSYTISLFTFGWFIPLFFITASYSGIAYTIYNEKRRHVSLQRIARPSKHRNRDKKVTLTVFLMIGAFVTSWLPYSVVSMWSAVGSFESIPMWAQLAPAVFAKCSIIWNPIIYVIRHSSFRKAVLDNIPFCASIRPRLPGLFNKTHKEMRKSTGSLRRAVLVQRTPQNEQRCQESDSEKLESFLSDNNNLFGRPSSLETFKMSTNTVLEMSEIKSGR